MKISEMIDHLEKIKTERGDIDVMFINPDSGEPYAVTSVSVNVAEKDEYPAGHDMPEGFTFVNLGSW